MDQSNETQLSRRHCADLCRQLHADSGSFDRLLLILSSFLLVISFTLTKNYVAGQTLALPGLLLTAWILFAVTILLTLVSYRLGHCAIEAHIAHVAECQGHHEEGTCEKRNSAAVVRRWVECLLSITFVVAVVLWLVVAAVNVL